MGGERMKGTIMLNIFVMFSRYIIFQKTRGGKGA
jgi:hypothetical protein